MLGGPHLQRSRLSGSPRTRSNRCRPPRWLRTAGHVAVRWHCEVSLEVVDAISSRMTMRDFAVRVNPNADVSIHDSGVRNLWDAMSGIELLI